jgi:hypothetical protein
MKIRFLLILAFISSYQVEAVAQEILKGVITEYFNGEGLIISYDFITGDKISWGIIDKSGNFEIPLKSDFLDDVKKMAVKAQKKAPKGFTLKFPTVGDKFTCSYPDIEFENPSAMISGLPDLILSDKRKKAENGNIYPVNNPSIANWLYDQKEDVAVGYYLSFFFMEEKSSAKGTCMINTYTGLGDENFDKLTLYDLELQPGWNIIRYGIEEVFESKNGKIFPLVTHVTNLKNLPQDLVWVRVLGD